MDLKLIITADSPLSFSERKPGGLFQHSLAYVPGSALRGALAASLLEDTLAAHQNHRFDPDCVFCRLFLSQEAAVFTHAYPVRDSGETVELLPATAVSCKQEDGFRPAGHGVFDTLIDRLCWEALEPAGLVYHPTCPACGGRVEVCGGFYVRHQHDGHQIHYHKREIDQRLLTRVAINRRRMVAEEGLLFSPYVVSEVVERDKHTRNEKPAYQPTTFLSQVWGLPNNDSVPAWLEGVTAIGGRSSRGLGHVTIQVEPAVRSKAQKIEERTRGLNQDIEQAWEYYQRLGGNNRVKEGTVFTLTLRSDAVFRTPQGLPTIVFDEKMLAAATVIQAQLIRSFASYGYGGGWQSAWGLPKPAEVLAYAGSVYVFETDQPDFQALANLEVQGIGERTLEGYGQVRVSDAFHRKRRETNE